MSWVELICQGCGYRMDAAECLEEPEAELRRGDLSMCMSCGMVYGYQEPGWRCLSWHQERGLPESLRVELWRMRVARGVVITRDLAFEQGHQERE